ncbi:MAG: DMT family transporter [Symploca sp. SIO2B6]|nr:DMT family transporter [Symploca sp. SIO2B6]
MTVPLAWFFFKDRPTPLRALVLAGVFFGIVLTMNIVTIDLETFQLASNIQGNLNQGGVAIALMSGAFFAFYLISMQLSFRKLHPVPVSVIQFFTIFALTSIILILFPAKPENINLSSHVGLFIGAIVLGSLTLAGYLLNNFGIRYMGAARASIIASSGPALTAFLAWTIVPGRNQLEAIQWLGIILVTVCVASLSLERLFMQQK